jgi:preprotein translocase subunit SecA
MPTTLIDDKVWWDRRRKLNGICDEVLAASPTGQNMLVLAHFEATLSEIETTLRSRSCQIERLAQIDSATLCSPAIGKTWSGLARSIPALNSAGDDWGASKLRHVERSSAKPLCIIVAEHHPLRSRDEQLITSTAELGCQAQLTFHLSLDDPLLTNFGVSSVQDLGRRLGIDEETFLSNPMITRAIRQGQEKIEREVPRDLPAWSIEDWFKHNLPAK